MRRKWREIPPKWHPSLHFCLMSQVVLGRGVVRPHARAGLPCEATNAENGRQPTQGSARGCGGWIGLANWRSWPHAASSSRLGFLETELSVAEETRSGAGSRRICGRSSARHCLPGLVGRTGEFRLHRTLPTVSAGRLRASSSTSGIMCSGGRLGDHSPDLTLDQGR